VTTEPVRRPHHDLKVEATLDVRRADAKVGEFVVRISALLTEDEPRLVDLSLDQNQGNRILLRSTQLRPEHTA
jgi:hypothetical protein